MSTAGLLFLTSNCLVALLLGFLIFIMTAYFSLPVRSATEGWRVARRMLSGLFGKAAPVAFVKEGQLIQPNDDQKKVAPKLALVDLTSSMVLGSPPGAQVVHSRSRSRSKNSAPAAPIGRIRVSGPGLVFVGAGETVRSVTSLRKQVRLAAGIQCRTNDGIEFKTNVFVIFSLIQPPTILKVGYLGKRLEDLRILSIDPQSGVLLSASDELEESDRAEVYVFSRARRNEQVPSTELVQDAPIQEYPPYPMDEAVMRRITTAAYYRPFNIPDQTRDDWADLPLEEAVRIFRNMISSVSYDDLFMPSPAYKYPLVERYKPHFVKAVRNQGILAYQLVRRIDGAPLAIGQKLDPADHQIYPAQEFSSQTILREQGIKIIHAGFSELEPGEAIRQQRLENWQARWQRKVEIERANQDLELMRIKNRARADAQRALLFKLSHILQSSPHSDEALAMRIFQALETAATDPATRQLLPHDAITLLRSLRQWLLPGEPSPVDLVE